MADWTLIDWKLQREQSEKALKLFVDETDGDDFEELTIALITMGDLSKTAAVLACAVLKLKEMERTQ